MKRVFFLLVGLWTLVANSEAVEHPEIDADNCGINCIYAAREFFGIGDGQESHIRKSRFGVYGEQPLTFLDLQYELAKVGLSCRGYKIGKSNGVFQFLTGERLLVLHLNVSKRGHFVVAGSFAGRGDYWILDYPKSPLRLDKRNLARYLEINSWTGKLLVIEENPKVAKEILKTFPKDFEKRFIYSAVQSEIVDVSEGEKFPPFEVPGEVQVDLSQSVGEFLCVKIPVENRGGIVLRRLHVGGECSCFISGTLGGVVSPGEEGELVLYFVRSKIAGKLKSSRILIAGSRESRENSKMVSIKWQEE